MECEIRFKVSKDDRNRAKEVSKILGLNTASLARHCLLEKLRSEEFILNQSNSKEV